MAIVLYDDGNHKCIKFHDLTDSGEIQSNQFLILDNKRGLLLDCGGYRVYRDLLGAIAHFIPAGCLDYIFLSHQDPDIGSGLNLWLPICKAQIMISALWARFIPAFCVRGLSEKRVTTIDDSGMRFQLGESRLMAVPGHFMHSPGNFHLYDETSKILFTSDLGASINPEMEQISTVEEFENHISSMSGFHNRYIPSSLLCRKWVEMVRPLDVEMIVPQHGARFCGKEIVEQFYSWVEQEKTAVDDFADTLFKLPA